MSDLPRVKIDGERHYEVNGKPYPSVTTVTSRHPEKKKGLNDWEKRVGPEEAERIRNQSALLGTVVHHRILNEYSITPLPKPETDLSHAYDGIMTDVETCLSMWDRLDFEVESMPFIEERIVSHEHEYAGTYDMMTDGTVVDLKTSPAFRGSHKWQIAAYFYAIRELSEYPDPSNAAIIKLHPDPERNPSLEAEVLWLSEDDLSEHFSTFKMLLNEYGN
jgi:hypothetical protein